ncbi:MAG: FMN-binding protein [Acetanaerobacterium sp.]
MTGKELAKDILLPAAVLTGIALVVTAALAFTNTLTAPIIAQNQQTAADLARIELVSGADTFTAVKLTDELTALGIEDIYDADNGAGTVVTVTEKGYNGDFTIMVGFNPEGAVVAYKALEQDETAGLGSNTFETPFADQFAGKTAGELAVVKGAAGADNEISAVTGATISSRAVTLAVNHAGEALNLVKEAG